jgi:methyl-accepting chemotaxis protein
MDKVTQQNAALVEEAAAAAKSMEDQTSAMTEMVGQFQVLPEFERGRAQPRTGNPVVDRSLNAGKEKLANVRSAPSRPAPAPRPAASSKPAGDFAPVRRRAVGAEDVDWKEF